MERKQGNVKHLPNQNLDKNLNNSNSEVRIEPQLTVRSIKKKLSKNFYEGEALKY